MGKSGWVAVLLLVLACGDDGSTGSQGASTGVTTTSGPASTGGASSGSGSTGSPADSSSTGSGACTPFDGIDDCDDGSFCLAMTATEGVCTPATSMGTNAGDGCGPEFAACAEDRLCQTISGGAILCVDMCRRPMGDVDCPPMFSCIDAYDLEEVRACAPA